MAALGALSGALDHRFALKLMRHGTWWAHPRLWLLLVGDPSSRKTPIINAATLPLEQHQTWLRENHQRELQDHVDSGGKPEQAPRAPARFVMWDTTTEKLGEILSHSERGLLVKRDEVTGWIGSMERYGTSGRGAGADRGFWLQAFDGGPFAQDRIGRGETYIKNLSVSLLGGIQPARLAELHGLTSDGLLQRFLPVMVRAPSVPQDMPGGEEAYAKLIKELILTPPKRLMLADDALVAMHQLHVYLHELEQASAGFAAGFQAFVGKLSGIAGSLALILHMVWNPGLGAVLPVEPITVEQVHDLLIDFLLPHSFAFYRNAETVTDGDRLQRLASGSSPPASRASSPPISPPMSATSAASACARSMDGSPHSSPPIGSNPPRWARSVAPGKSIPTSQPNSPNAAPPRNTAKPPSHPSCTHHVNHASHEK